MKNYKSVWTQGIPDDAKVVRTEVFVIEQGFPVEIELDQLDDVVLHIVLYENDIPIATGRIIQETPTQFRLGRIAVLQDYRKSGIGARIMKFMEAKAAELGAIKLLLSAQFRTQGFYEKCGYIAIGGTYTDHHVEHIDMEKDI